MKMPMERSLSCAPERSAAYAQAPADLRCHSASFNASYAPPPGGKQQQQVVKRAASSLSRPAMQRSGSTASAKAAGPTPGLNLRCYSASYAASYSPFADGAGATAAAQQKGPSGGAGPAWSAAGRRSVNLRGYTPSFSALQDDAVAAPVPVPAKKAAAPSAGTGAGGFVDDAELQRRKRLVAYKAYDVEGKVKQSVRRSVKWIKIKCSRVVHGSGAD